MTVQSLPFTDTASHLQKKYLPSSPCSTSTPTSLSPPPCDDGQPKHTKPPPPSSSSSSTQRVSSSCVTSSSSTSSTSSTSPSSPSSSSSSSPIACCAAPAPRFVGTMSAGDFVKAVSVYLTRRLVQCAAGDGGAQRGGAVSVLERVFYSEYDPKIAVGAYVRRLVVHARCSPAVFVVALVLWERFHDRQRHLTPSALNMHRLLITAVMVAAKCTDDATGRARFYAAVGGMRPGTGEMVHMEASFLSLVDYRVFVSTEEYEGMVTVLQQLV